MGSFTGFSPKIVPMPLLMGDPWPMIPWESRFLVAVLSIFFCCETQHFVVTVTDVASENRKQNRSSPNRFSSIANFPSENSKSSANSRNIKIYRYHIKLATSHSSILIPMNPYQSMNHSRSNHHEISPSSHSTWKSHIQQQQRCSHRIARGQGRGIQSGCAPRKRRGLQLSGARDRRSEVQMKRTCGFFKDLFVWGIGHLQFLVRNNCESVEIWRFEHELWKTTHEKRWSSN